MLSPAKAHFARLSAATGAQATARTHQPSDQHLLMAAALVEDRRRLHGVQSIARKIELKAQLLPQYQPYIDGVLAADAGGQDEVFSFLLLWTLDVGAYDKALLMAAYALKHGLSAPDGHQRTCACIVAEEIAEGCLRAMAKGQGASLDVLRTALDLLAGRDMPDPVRAKLYKALGYAQRDAEQSSEALLSLRQALELDARAGVKKDIALLEKLEQG